MELGLQFTDLTCWEKTGHAAVSHEETMETAIAEYCPDMTRIVTACGQLYIREKTASEERVTVSGTVRVTVLYTSEESTGLRSLTVSVPFSCTAEDRELASAQLIWATGRLLLVEAQAVTARKLYIRLLPEVTMTGYIRTVRRICSGTEENAALRVRCRDHVCSLLDAVVERDITVTQEVQVSPVPEELLLYRLYPRLSSCRTVGNKLVVKGEAALSALYRGQDQQLHTYDTELPLSQILDGGGLPEDGEYAVRLCLTGGEARVLRSDNGGGLSVTVELRLLLCAYRTERCTCVEDLYSIRQPVRLEQETVTLPAAHPDCILREETVEHLDFGGNKPFFFITDTDCANAAVTTEAGQTALRTTVRTRLLYLDENDSPAVTERASEVVLPVKEMVQGLCCGLSGGPGVQLGAGGCDVRQVVEFLAEDAQQEPLVTVCGGELLEPEEQGQTPSLVLRRLLPGETLWDAAKQYRTDEALLRAVNRLEGEELPDKMLLIPRVR